MSSFSYKISKAIAPNCIMKVKAVINTFNFKKINITIC